MGALVSVGSIEVLDGRLRLQVRLAPGAPRMTGPLIGQLARQARPTLPSHGCVNGVGPTFGAVLERTSVPHLLEHLIIDEQVRASAGAASLPFVGTTAWCDEARSEARIEVNFYDDLTALAAVSRALDALNALLEQAHAAKGPAACSGRARGERDQGRLDAKEEGRQ